MRAIDFVSPLIAERDEAGAQSQQQRLLLAQPLAQFAVARAADLDVKIGDVVVEHTDERVDLRARTFQRRHPYAHVREDRPRVVLRSRE